MKNRKLRNTVVGLVASAMLATGCGANWGMRIDGPALTLGNSTAIYFKDDERADETMFLQDADSYDRSELTNGAVKEGPMWKQYQKAIGAEEQR